MIALLVGKMLEKSPHEIIVEAGGVGYRASISLTTFTALPDEGEMVRLRIHTHVREDSLALYGFASRQEQLLFERLIDISGVGPRLALAILSGLPAADLIDVISQGDAGRLKSIPGVGPRTADRVILEMRDRIKALAPARLAAEAGGGPTAGGKIHDDVVSALVNLGYREKQAENAVSKALRESSSGLKEVLRLSLKYIGS